jgi:hypothetical protein
VIPTKTCRNLARIHRNLAKFGRLLFCFVFVFFFFLSFLIFLGPKIVGEEQIWREHGVGEEGLPDSGDFVGFWPIFQNSGEISQESLL